MSEPAPESTPETPVAETPPDSPAGPGDWDEDLYRATCTVLVEPEPAISAWQGIGCLIAGAGLFALSFWSSKGVRVLGLLIPVMFLHEAGHLLGMLAFGYRNPRIFLLPFFGAAVSGRKSAVAVWQQSVVLLLGPLPGLLLALGLQFWLKPVGESWPAWLVFWLVFLNGVNLLPVAPFDGGRLLDLLLFARRPLLTVAFQLLAVLALFALAVILHEWIIGALGGLMLLAGQARYRQAKLQTALGDAPPDLPERLDDIGDGRRRELFAWVERLHPLSHDPVSLAGHLRSLHERLVSPRPGLLARVILLALYLGGVASVLGAVEVSLRHTREHEEQVRRRQADELADGFFETVRRMNELRARRDRLPGPRGRNVEELKRLNEEIRRVWAELIEEWKSAPEGVQGSAIVQVNRRADRRTNDPNDDSAALQRSLGYIPAATRSR